MQRKHYVWVVIFLVFVAVSFVFLSSEQISEVQVYQEELQELPIKPSPLPKTPVVHVVDKYHDLPYLFNLRMILEDVLRRTEDPYEHPVFLNRTTWGSCFHDSEFYRMVCALDGRLEVWDIDGGYVE